MFGRTSGKKRRRLGAYVAVENTNDAWGLQIRDYALPKVRPLRRAVRRRLKKMGESVDVETLEVFEHELAAFEAAGLAELAGQRTRHADTVTALVTVAHRREQLVANAIVRADVLVERSNTDLERLEHKLADHDPDFHSYA